MSKKSPFFALHPHRRKPDGGAVTPQLAVRAGKSEHNFRPCGQPQQGGLEILPGLYGEWLIAASSPRSEMGAAMVQIIMAPVYVPAASIWASADAKT